ncbi:site-specific recombinase XerD [Rhizobium leguminosarum]|uniref:tyrosine-type recombinase/integrase n=1 Tax=Rhizobium leguminosarum TaxID=384 RepID=UPI001AE3E7CC|nr:tyrosine-type recombinase/integrase [Rhizobium leguminosarum]MBP2488987.1 site-specific recombinase XerD [Rhizobium leguminosarum]
MLPFLRKRPDGRVVICNADGTRIIAPTLFLDELSETLESTTILEYGSMLLEPFRLLAKARHGAGLSWPQTDDDFLSRWHLECITRRKISKKVFVRRLKIYLRFLLWAQENGWSKHHVGVQPGKGERRFAISIRLVKGNVWHHLMKGKQRKKKTRLPPGEVLDLVESSLAEGVVKPALIRRNHLAMTCCRILTFRRSEVAALRVATIPTRGELSRLAASGAVIKSLVVKRAKGAGERYVDFPVSTLVAIRDFIDFDRPKLLGASGKDEGYLFCADNRSGRALCPGTITNAYKSAAHRAADQNPELADAIRPAHPHHLRHRAITDFAAGLLAEGMTADQAMLTVMDQAAVSSLGMARHYMHLAEADVRKRSKEWKAAEKDLDRRSGARLAALQADRFERRKRS